MNIRLFKITSFILFLSVTALFSSCSKDSKQPETNIKTDKSGESTSEKPSDGNSENKSVSSDKFIIEYRMDGVIPGNMTLYRSGNLLKQVVSTEFLGVRSSNNMYIKNDTVYSVTESAGKTFGQRTNLNEYNKTKQSGETIIDIKEFQKFIETKKLIGTETILGYKCDVYEIGPEMTQSVYDKKYVLRINIPQFQAVAVKLDLNPSFSGNEFEVPGNVSFNSDYSKKMNKEDIESILKNLKK